MILGVFSSPAQKGSREAQFWEWFQRHEDELFRLRSGRDPIFKSLADKIKNVNRSLVFEFGPVENGQREFVVSAGGLKSVFPAVVSLADAAPVLPRWKITKFRPRRSDITAIEIGSANISSEEVMITYQQGTLYVDIAVFIGESDLDEKIRAQLGFLFLDQALGEFDVATYLGGIKFKPKSAVTNSTKISLQAFVKELDKIKAFFN